MVVDKAVGQGLDGWGTTTRARAGVGLHRTGARLSRAKARAEPMMKRKVERRWHRESQTKGEVEESEAGGNTKLIFLPNSFEPLNQSDSNSTSNFIKFEMNSIRLTPFIFLYINIFMFVFVYILERVLT